MAGNRICDRGEHVKPGRGEQTNPTGEVELWRDQGRVRKADCVQANSFARNCDIGDLLKWWGHYIEAYLWGHVGFLVLDSTSHSASSESGHFSLQWTRYSTLMQLIVPYNIPATAY